MQKNTAVNSALMKRNNCNVTKRTTFSTLTARISVICEENIISD